MQVVAMCWDGSCQRGLAGPVGPVSLTGGRGFVPRIVILVLLVVLQDSNVLCPHHFQERETERLAEECPVVLIPLDSALFLLPAWPRKGLRWQPVTQ